MLNYRLRLRSGGVVSSLLLLLLVAMGEWVQAQEGYVLKGKCAKSMGGGVSLQIYVDSGTVRKQYQRIRNGEFSFTGKVASPTLALLTFANKQQLYLYLEPSDMTVEVVSGEIESSPVTGSRSNSQYRYIVEQMSDGRRLSDYVRQNPESIFAPFLIYRSMRSMDVGDLEKVYRTMDTVLASSYHYVQIGRYLSDMASLSEGSKMKDFGYTENGKEVRLSQMLVPQRGTLIFFGATWCDICRRDIDEVRRVCKVDSVTLVVVNIDDSKRGWDAEYVEMLDISHIPYMILLDGDACIVGRDIRVWELSRRLEKVR